MNVNTPAQPFSGTMDVDEFMAFLETRPDNERWDLIEGVAVMMAPPSYEHQRITRNFLRASQQRVFRAAPRFVRLFFCRRAQSWASKFPTRAGRGGRAWSGKQESLL